MACHIVAAAGGPGARRVDRSLSPQQRSSIENGIWLCHTHGKLIDTDEHRFSIEMLKKWRAIAEARARYEQQYGRGMSIPASELHGLGFAEEVVTITGLGRENAAIGEALDDSCVPVIWGLALADSIRDVFIEVTRNAFYHGGATICRIQIEHEMVSLTENGAHFNSLELPIHIRSRGGGASIRSLFELFGDRLLIGAQRQILEGEEVNAITLALATLSNLHLMEPCCASLASSEIDAIEAARVPFGIFQAKMRPCHVVYFKLRDYMSSSDAIGLPNLLPSEEIRGKRVVFIGRNVSSVVEENLSRLFPACRVIDVSKR